jgi:hypothetical protein
MSLEAEITANTAAIKELIVVWGKLALRGNAVTAKVDAGTTTLASQAPTAAPSPEPAAPSPEPAAPAAIDYAAVSFAITEGVKADRPKVIVTLAAFGVSKGTQLKVEQYAGFMAALAA